MKATQSSSSSSHARQSREIENVLILQGGGSLGAFGCGVFKALAERNIKLDIVAGTSIGGVNAAIIAASRKNSNLRPEQALEQFWLELSDGFVDLNGHTAFFPPYPLDLLVQRLIANTLSSYYLSSYSSRGGNQDRERVREVIEKHRSGASSEGEIKLDQLGAFASSALFGNGKMFNPRWRPEYAFADPDYFAPPRWTYLYDHSALEKTLNKYVDYTKLNPTGNPNARLIITATNVLNAQPLVFDSSKQQITPKHILATSGYPLYNFPWIEVEEGIYAWDGSLLSNTPLREVIAASPVNNKRIFLVENYPKKIDVLPRNLPEVHHRARDIIFCDKSEHNVTMSKVITRYLQYIEELYQIVEEHADHSKIDKVHLEKIRRKYKMYKEEHGAEIKEVYYISREEPFPHMYENADFSPETIRNSIEEGEEKTNQVIEAAR